MLAHLEQRLTFHQLDAYRAQAFPVTDYDPQSDRFVIFSDAHKGDYRRTVDEFKPNEAIYCQALQYYLDHDYRLILNGDMEEGWKNRYENIMAAYENSVYALEGQFAAMGAQHYLKIWGNHDSDWRDERIVDKYLCGVLKHKTTVHPAVSLGGKIIITHGHQGEPNNDGRFALVSRWVVRYIWYYTQKLLDLERKVMGDFNHPLGRRERHLYQWARSRKMLLIAGHTHRPMFHDLPNVPNPVNARPQQLTPYYINSGSCLSKDEITAIEVDRGEIRLINWSRSDEPQASREIYQRADLGRMLACI